MGLQRYKRGREHITNDEGGDDDDEDEYHQDPTMATESVSSCHILELPMHLIYDILSRLPPTNVCCCRCVCKTFLNILTDPYFAKIHFRNAPNDAASLVFQDSSLVSGIHFVYMLDLEETSSASSCTTHNYHSHHHRHSRPRLTLTMQNTKDQLYNKFQFFRGQITVVGSCNGLLCLVHDSWPNPLYYVCNPILGEFRVLPKLTQVGLFMHSGFGFCPRTNQYKVIRFTCLKYSDPVTALFSRKTLAEVHTLGTESWRSIGNAPWPMAKGTLDSSLNGVLHWVTDSLTAFNLICSFDLETEQFRSVPTPTHFNPDHVKKISWINVGILGGDLCLCYVIDDAQFDVWVMKDYGVKESWTREFTIDIKFYCGVQPELLHKPIKFLNTGDLLFLCSPHSLVSYSPRKGTFREFKDLGNDYVAAIAHNPSFISLKDIEALV